MPVGVYTRTEAHRAINRKHGACAGLLHAKRTPEYTAWRMMKARCYNTNNDDYPNYGGRGIVVCDRWRNDYLAFLADMGNRPSSSHSLDRKDSTGHYEPANCRWATPTEQTRGRRKAIFVTVNGERLPLVEWAQRCGVGYSTLLRRLRRDVRRGCTPEQSLAKSLPNEVDVEEAGR